MRILKCLSNISAFARHFHVYKLFSYQLSSSVGPSQCCTAFHPKLTKFFPPKIPLRTTSLHPVKTKLTFLSTATLKTGPLVKIIAVVYGELRNILSTKVWDSISGRCKRISLLQHRPDLFWIRPASYSTGTGFFPPAGKATEA